MLERDIELRDELPWLEGMLLTAMRTWVFGCKRGIATDGQIEAIFAGLRASEATAYLDRLLRALNAGCTRMIEISCLCDPALSADEVLLLDTLALQQERRDTDATLLLQAFVTPASASEAAGNALGIVQVLNAAGHVLRRAESVIQRRGLGKFDRHPLAGIATQMN